MKKETSKFKRQIAFKVRIKDLINGRYVKEEGWEPNYINTKDGKNVSRVNLIGTVVAKQNDGSTNYESLILDDGSGKISVREFRENKSLNKAEIGNVVIVIGRPREYGSEKYVVPEIVKIINNEKWIIVRKLELEKEIIPENDQEVIEEEVVEQKEIPLSQKIYDWIKEKDLGDGVDSEEIIKIYKEGAEKIIRRFLIDGEIFEIKPGRLKVLE